MGQTSKENLRGRVHHDQCQDLWSQITCHDEKTGVFFFFLIESEIMVMRSIILSALFSCVIATALDDYVAKADSNYVWTDTVSFDMGG